MRLQARQIRRLIDWVSRLVPEFYRPEHLSVKLHDDPQFAGFTGRGEVEFYIPRHLPQYPRRYVYRKGAGPLRFDCWHEEMVALAAHEFRHIAQEQCRAKDRPKHYEVDAEAVARFVLDIWRSKKRCSHARA